MMTNGYSRPVRSCTFRRSVESWAKRLAMSPRLLAQLDRGENCARILLAISCCSVFLRHRPGPFRTALTSAGSKQIAATTHRISMGVVRPGTIGPAPEGLERSGRRPATAFLFRDAKPMAAEKSRRRTLRETSEAKPVFGQTHANRDRGWSARLGKSGEYGNGGRPLRLDAREREWCGLRWPIHRRPDLCRHARPQPFRGGGGCWTCGPVLTPSLC